MHLSPNSVLLNMGRYMCVSVCDYKRAIIQMEMYGNAEKL